MHLQLKLELFPKYEKKLEEDKIKEEENINFIFILFDGDLSFVKIKDTMFSLNVIFILIYDISVNVFIVAHGYGFENGSDGSKRRKNNNNSDDHDIMKQNDKSNHPQQFLSIQKGHVILSNNKAKNIDQDDTLYTS